MTESQRVDLHIVNEAAGWSLTSACMNGRADRPFASREAPIPDPAEWSAEVLRGTMIPMELATDESFNVRVIVNAPLTKAEDGAWVDKLIWKLSIPDGQLVLAGGAEHLMYGLEEAGFMAPYLHSVHVPPGSYRVEIYTTIHSVNARPPDCYATVAEWWAATRPDEAPPKDMESRSDDGEVQLPIDFIVRLTPLESDPDAPVLSELGWFPPGNCRRILRKCPKGILSRSVKGLPTKSPVQGQSGLRYRHNVFELVAKLEPKPLSGGPLQMEISDVTSAFLLAEFCGNRVHPELRISGSGNFDFAVLQSHQLVSAAPAGDGWLVEFDGEASQNARMSALSMVADALRKLPENATLEVAVADRSRVEHPDTHVGPRELGWHRYLGKVRAGEWLLEATYPSAEAEVLRQMLSLARETLAGRGIRLMSEDESKNLVRRVRRDDMFFLAKPEMRDGALVLPPGEESMYGYLGAWVFWWRFRSVWPTRKM